MTRLEEIRKRFDPGMDGYALECTEVEYLLDTCQRYEEAIDKAIAEQNKYAACDILMRAREALTDE